VREVCSAETNSVSSRDVRGREVRTGESHFAFQWQEWKCEKLRRDGCTEVHDNLMLSGGSWFQVGLVKDNNKAFVNRQVEQGSPGVSDRKCVHGVACDSRVRCSRERNRRLVDREEARNITDSGMVHMLLMGSGAETLEVEDLVDVLFPETRRSANCLEALLDRRQDHGRRRTYICRNANQVKHRR
jgi:hypothetical protein